jgi:hypothetical protein
MKYVLVAFWIIVMCGVAESQKSTEGATIAIGPWQIDASFTEERKLDRCVMSRTNKEGIEARFTREEDGLSLVMTSPRWELDKGKTYPVEFAAGSTTWKADVTATSDAVRISLTDQLFNDALKKANFLEIRAAGQTITVPLNKSAAAFARLERCYQTNNKAGETNPFVAPKP